MKSDFSVAVHALVYLSVKGCTLSSDALADNICTNAARVRKVMARLKKAGLVGAREGSEGGFCPQVPPAELTLDRVAAAVDPDFVESGWHSGAADRRRLAGVTIADIEDRLFAGKPLFAAEQELTDGI